MTKSINLDQVIGYMAVLQSHRITYSMAGSRTGADGTADCSGALYAALRVGGATDAGYVLDTDTLPAWLAYNGFIEIASNGAWSAQRGDVFIWGEKSQSAGGNGHTGIFVNEREIINCNYPENGIAIDQYHAFWEKAHRPYYRAYRYDAANARANQQVLDK
ncbi:MAG: hypothetical protein LKJ06_07790 [Schleiferilactobacillus harbinensis]|jgi:hypothetical protein|nr:hypothetical protein [Schleiferilactobacillus harbinensis]